MNTVASSMHKLAEELGVKFMFGQNVQNINIENGRAVSVTTDKQTFFADAIISAADYHFTETVLLPDSPKLMLNPVSLVTLVRNSLTNFQAPKYFSIPVMST